jgi:hypothetical protein
MYNNDDFAEHLLIASNQQVYLSYLDPRGVRGTKIK